MAFAVSPNQDTIELALWTFLTSILPGVDVILGQVNRVAEPKAADFVVFTPMFKVAISMNVSGEEDARYTGAIAGTVLTVSAVAIGTIIAGAPVFGVGVATGTTIVSLGSGTGGAGTYNLSGAAQSVSSRSMASGVDEITRPTELTVQCDVHGPASADNAQIISTLFADDTAFDRFVEIDPTLRITPLYSSDPKQAPFTNAEKQIEFRWVVDLALEANQSIIYPQQFADVVSVDVVSVEATYPL